MTVQYSDKIIYKGKECPLRTYPYPMENYFEKYPDKRPKSEGCWTSLWRGYVATFEIKDNQLFLKDIEIRIHTKNKRGDYRDSWESVIDEVFPNREILKIDWLTETLTLRSGEIVDRIGYASIYEHYTLLEIENGDLKNEKEFGHEEYKDFREKQFQACKSAAGFDDESFESFLRIFEFTEL